MTPVPTLALRRGLVTTLGAAVAGALIVAGPPALAQNTQTVEVSGGASTLTLDRKSARALSRAHVRVTARGGARRAGGRIRLPIEGEFMDPVDARPADIHHEGALRFSRGRRRAVLREIEFHDSNLEAKLGRVGVTVARLRGGNVARQGIESTDINGRSVRLTRAGARALNRALRTKAFRTGMRLGKVSSDTTLAEGLVAPGGQTNLQVSPQAAQKLAQAQVTPSAQAPATFNPTQGSFSFPITGGKLNPTTFRGEFRHAGGLVLTKGSTQVTLSEPYAVLDATPALTVNLRGARAEPADIDVSSMTKSVLGKSVQTAGAVVKLNAGGAAALNAAFQTTVFVAGDVVGTASTSGTFK